ncbi:hypothetical protein [Pedosphaera parvula]|nr:hypothetical protein [Pedosphaera parvula]
MKLKLTVALTLAVALLYGCAKPSAPTTNLGAVEVATTKLTRHYPLSGDRDCTLTLTTLIDGQVLVEAVVLRKDAQGNVTVLARPRKKAPFGQEVSLPIGDGNIVLTPKRI